MGFFLGWMEAHWFDVVQTLGIVGGLVFTGLSARKETKGRKIANLLTIHGSHREIWMRIFDDPHLLRVLKPGANLGRKPVTRQESIFVNLIILHVTSVLAAMRAGVMEKPAGLDADLAEFFSLPVPAQVWQDTLQYRDEPTLKYVKGLMVTSYPEAVWSCSEPGKSRRTPKSRHHVLRRLRRAFRIQ